MISSDGDICMWPHNSQPGSRLVFYLPLSTMQEVDCHFHMWKAFFPRQQKWHTTMWGSFSHIILQSGGLTFGLIYNCGFGF